MISTQCGFEISYLYSIVLQIIFSNATMDALTNIYNEMHSTHWESEEEMEKDKPKEINDNIEQDEDEFDECVETRRGKIPLKMTTEIMGHAVYTWMLLDFRKRWDIPVKFESKLSKT